MKKYAIMGILGLLMVSMTPFAFAWGYGNFHYSNYDGVYSTRPIVPVYGAVYPYYGAGLIAPYGSGLNAVAYGTALGYPPPVYSRAYGTTYGLDNGFGYYPGSFAPYNALAAPGFRAVSYNRWFY